MRTRGVVSRWIGMAVCAACLGLAGPARAGLIDAVYASTSSQNQLTPITGNGTFTATANSPGEFAQGQAVVSATGVTAAMAVSNNGLIQVGPVPGQEPVASITQTDLAQVSLTLKPLVNTTYHLGGSFTVTGFVAGSEPVPGINIGATITSEYKASLVDEGVGAIFSEDKIGSIGTLTFDAQDGTLLAGHTYFFTTSISLTLDYSGLPPDPGGSATTNFTLAPVGPGGGGVTVPLPRGAMGGLALLGAMLLAGRRWRTAWC